MRWFFSVVTLWVLVSGCTYTGLENVECDRTADCPDQAVCRSGFCAFDSTTNTNNNTNNLLTVTRVTLEPGDLALVPTETAQLTATAFNSAGDPLSDVIVQWSTSNESVAVVVGGLVTAVDVGAADITATVDGVSASVTATVVNPVDRLEITPSTAEIGLATRFQLSAKAFDAGGNEITVPLTWSTNDPNVASISDTGQVFGVAVGETTIAVSATNVLTGAAVQASAAISVVEYPIVSLVIGPRDERLRQGDSLLLTAVLTDDQGNQVIGKTVTWSYSPAFLGGFSSPDPDTALFVASSQMTGVATIRAVYEGLMDETTVEVYRPMVQTVTVNPANSTAKVGAFVSFTASAIDEDGLPVTGRAVSWFVDNSDLASIDANGQLKTLASGTVTVTATIDGVMGETQLTIQGFDLQQVSAGTDHACGITPAGFAFCWGDGANGRLGDNTTDVSSLPVAVDTDLTFDEIHAGNRHTCARTGTDIYCWGDQSSGRVGNGQTGTSDILTPVKVSGTEMFKAFSLSNDHACAIDDQDDLYCWGEGNDGRLANNSTADLAAPTKIIAPAADANAKWMSVAAGFDHTCALTTLGVAYCWGHNTEGELGNGETTESRVAVRVDGTAVGNPVFANISTGRRFSCAATAAGALYCWGENTNGELGIDSADTNRLTPAQVPTLAFTQFDLGRDHACGVSTNQGYCWGVGANGRLGSGDTVNLRRPGLITGTAFSSISAGDGFSCGVAGGTGYCFGENPDGQLGDNTLVEKTSPVVVYP